MDRRSTDRRAVYNRGGPAHGRAGVLVAVWDALRGRCGSRTWAAIFMLGITALIGLLSAAFLSGRLSPAVTAITLAGGAVWAVFTAFVLVRKRVGSAEIVFYVAATQVAATVTGVGYGDGVMQALTILGLLAIALVGSMFFTPRGIVISAAGCLAGMVVIIATTQVALSMKIVASVAAALIVVATVATVALLVGRLSRARQAAETMAGTDQLTGMLNRRGMSDGARRLVAQARREQHLVTVMTADIDHFKRVNDTYGHDVGDQVLVAVARTMLVATRTGGLLVRLGGEELAFLAGFPDVDAIDRAAERLRAAVAAASVRGVPGGVTVSIGVSHAPPVEDGDVPALLTRLLTEADRAMYDAKRAGRNCVARAGAAAPNTVPTGLAAVTAQALAGVRTPGPRRITAPRDDA